MSNFKKLFFLTAFRTRSPGCRSMEYILEIPFRAGSGHTHLRRHCSHRFNYRNSDYRCQHNRIYRRVERKSLHNPICEWLSNNEALSRIANRITAALFIRMKQRLLLVTKASAHVKKLLLTITHWLFSLFVVIPSAFY